MSFAVWLTGLPGAGKSAIARELGSLLAARKVEYCVLESDVLRTQLTPNARYGEAEREWFYGGLAHLGAFCVQTGRPVIFDATANLRRYRDAARSRIGRFAEAYVDTPFAVCRGRDPKGLYRDGATAALPGLQAPYEPPLAPELVLHGAGDAPEDSAAALMRWLEQSGWLAAGAGPGAERSRG